MLEKYGPDAPKEYRKRHCHRDCGHRCMFLRDGKCGVNRSRHNDTDSMIGPLRVRPMGNGAS